MNHETMQMPEMQDLNFEIEKYNAQNILNNLEQLQHLVNRPDSASQYQRKLKANLKIFNQKLNDLLEDGLKGVNNLCNRVKRCLSENEMREYMSKCGHGDMASLIEEVDNTKQEKTEITLVYSEKSIQTDDYEDDQEKQSYKIQQLNTMNLKTISPSYQTLESRTLLNNSQLKPKQSKKVTNKKQSNPNSPKIQNQNVLVQSEDFDFLVESSSSHEFSMSNEEIMSRMERDYQKVMQSLLMVEHMMASLNEKIEHQHSINSIDIKPFSASSELDSIHNVSTVDILEDSNVCVDRVEFNDKKLAVKSHESKELLYEQSKNKTEDDLENLCGKINALQGNIFALHNASTFFQTVAPMVVTKNSSKDLSSDQNIDFEPAQIHETKSKNALADATENDSPDHPPIIHPSLSEESVANGATKTEYEDCLTSSSVSTVSLQKSDDQQILQNDQMFQSFQQNNILDEQQNTSKYEELSSSKADSFEEKTQSFESFEQMKKIYTDVQRASSENDKSDFGLNDQIKTVKDPLIPAGDYLKSEDEIKPINELIRLPSLKVIISDEGNYISEKKSSQEIILKHFDTSNLMTFKEKVDEHPQNKTSFERLEDEIFQEANWTNTEDEQVDSSNSSSSLKIEVTESQKENFIQNLLKNFCENYAPPQLEQNEYVADKNESTLNNRRYLKSKRCVSSRSKRTPYKYTKRRGKKYLKKSYNPISKKPCSNKIKSVPSSSNCSTDALISTTQTLKEIKRFHSSTSGFSDTSSIDESIFKKPNRSNNLDPMLPIRAQCKKMMSELIGFRDIMKYNLNEMLNGNFNYVLIERLKCEAEFKRRVSGYVASSVRSAFSSLNIQSGKIETEPAAIAPEVRRKKGLCDLYDRMQKQIRQSDSFDGFLNLMDRAKRRAMIAQAERLDQKAKLRIKFQAPRCKRNSTFYLVSKNRSTSNSKTVNVQPSDSKKLKQSSDRDVSKKYVNSLWFSPRDFKLRKNSRIFNEQRLQTYCKSLSKVQRDQKRPPTPTPQEPHAILMQSSGISITQRSYNRNRISSKVRSPVMAARRNLNHCDILDDLTTKDLEPFNAEYPRNDIKKGNEKNMEKSLFYKLAFAGDKGRLNEEALADLIAPKIECSERNCQKCMNIAPTKFEKKSSRPKRPRNDGKTFNSEGLDASTANIPIAKKNKKTESFVDYQSLSAKQATQLLVQNITEIKARKSQFKCVPKVITNKFGENRSVEMTQRRKERKASNSPWWMKRRSFNSARESMMNCNTDDAKRPKTPSKRSRWNDLEIAHRPIMFSTPLIAGKKKAFSSLLPYMVDPNSKVLQLMTVLPVKVYYDKNPITMMSEKNASTVEIKRQYDLIKNTSNHLVLNEFFEESEFISEKPSNGDGYDTYNRVESDQKLGTNSELLERTSCNSDVPQINLPPYQTNDVFNLRSISEQTRSKGSNLGPSTNIDKAYDYKNRKIGLSSKKRKIDKPTVGAHKNLTNQRRPSTPPTNSRNHKAIKVNESKSFHKPSSLSDSTGKLIKMSTMKDKSGSSLPNSARHAFKMCERYISAKNPVIAIPSIGKINEVLNRHYETRKELRHGLKPQPEVQRKTASYKKEPKPVKTHKAMMDHLRTLKVRNTNLQNNIQKAIDIIEDKMYEVLATKDNTKKKETIGDMEKEVNDVLRMINEENYQDRPSKSGKQEFGLNKLETESKISTSRKLKQNSETHPITNNPSFITTRSSTASSTEKFVITNAVEPPRIRQQKISLLTEPNENQSDSENKSTEKLNGCDLIRSGCSKTSIASKVVKISEIELDSYVSLEADAVKKKVEFVQPLREFKEKNDELFYDNLGNDKKEILTENRNLKSTSLPINLPLDIPPPSITPIGSIRTPYGNRRLMRNKKYSKILLKDGNEKYVEKKTLKAKKPLMVTAIKNEMFELAIRVDLEDNGETSSAANNLAGFECKIFNSESDITDCGGCVINKKIKEPIKSYSPMERKSEQLMSPFMKALAHLRSGKLISPNRADTNNLSSFGKFINFLDTLSESAVGTDRSIWGSNADIKMIWNPEKRSSFHGTIHYCRSIQWRRQDSRVFSDHSLLCNNSSMTNKSSLINYQKIVEKKRSKTDLSEIEPEYEEKELVTIDIKPSDGLKQIFDKELREIYKNPEPNILKTESVSIVITTENSLEINYECDKKTSQTVPDCYCGLNSGDGPGSLKKIGRSRKKLAAESTDRHKKILKYFYVCYYTFVYICLASLNFVH